MIGDDGYGHRRPRGGDLISAHRGVGEVLKRNWLVVPLYEVANDCRRILRTVNPVDLLDSGSGVSDVAKNHENRYSIAVCVVDGHRRVLQTHRAVNADQERFPLDFGVSVSHGDRGLFMATRNKLR